MSMGQYLGLIGQKILAIKVDKDFIVTDPGFKIRRIKYMPPYEGRKCPLKCPVCRWDLC